MQSVVTNVSIRKTIFWLFLLCLIWLSIALPAHALTVSPAKIEITADPGQSYRGEIEIFNEQDEIKTFFTSHENFEPLGDSGAPHFIGSKDGLATWISTAAQYTVSPGERKIVSYTISIPIGTEAGGYFAAIFFGSQPPQGSGGGEVTIGGKIGVLILLRVSGDIEEGGGLINFSTSNNQRFFSTLPIDFEYRLNNIGGDRTVPKGELKVKNTLRITSATLLANENGGSVLPGSARKFKVTWDKGSLGIDIEESEKGFFTRAGEQWKSFHFGWYSAQLNLSWGEFEQTATDSYQFFIFPWQLMLIVLFVVLIIFFLGRMALRRYARAILTKARK